MAEEDEVVPPALAQQLHQGKQIAALEQQLADLQKIVKTQHSTISTTETQLRSTISQADLRRAIGLAFQEFEMRMQEELQQTHRTVLSQFCKRDEVQEVVSLVSKKVNWHDYQALLGKVTELRTYIDHTAESVFLGHRDALQQEFARKADASSVDMALKSKADFREINDLRARLERLEMLFTGAGIHQSARLDELREELTSTLNMHVKTLKGALAEQGEEVKAIKNWQGDALSGIEDYAHKIQHVGARLDELESNMPTSGHAMESLEVQANQTEDLLREVREEKDRQRQETNDLQAAFRNFEESFTGKFKEVVSGTKRVDSQVEFLTEASETLKRRLREVARGLTEQHKSLAMEKDLLEARLSQLIQQQEFANLPEKVHALETRIDAIPGSRSETAQSQEKAEVPVVALLRRMVEDALPDVTLEAPSLSGSPQLALPMPPGKPRPRIERLVGMQGLSPRHPAAAKPPRAK